MKMVHDDFRPVQNGKTQIYRSVNENFVFHHSDWFQIFVNGIECGNVGRAISFLALIGFVTIFKLILFCRHSIVLPNTLFMKSFEQVLQKG